MLLPIEKIYPNPDQPRKQFDPEKLSELAMSIKEYGVVEPIVVTPRGDRFMIIAGERRYRASHLAGLSQIPANILEADNNLVEEIALLENIQRQDLNIIEEAHAYNNLLCRGLTRDEICKKIGIRQPWRIDERVSLLNLLDEYKDLLKKNKLSPSQAYEISRVPKSKQSIIFRKIQSGELNTYNKLRAFTDGILMQEKQISIFTFQSLSVEEVNTIEKFEQLLEKTEKYTGMLRDLIKVFPKQIFGKITARRIELSISSLSEIKKITTKAEGLASAIKECA